MVGAFVGETSRAKSEFVETLCGKHQVVDEIAGLNYYHLTAQDCIPRNNVYYSYPHLAWDSWSKWDPRVTFCKNSASIADRLIVSNAGCILEKLHSGHNMPLSEDFDHLPEIRAWKIVRKFFKGRCRSQKIIVQRPITPSDVTDIFWNFRHGSLVKIHFSETWCQLVNMYIGLEEEELTKTFFQLNAGVCMVSNTSYCMGECIRLITRWYRVLPKHTRSAGTW